MNNTQTHKLVVSSYRLSAVTIALGAILSMTCTLATHVETLKELEIEEKI